MFKWLVFSPFRPLTVSHFEPGDLNTDSPAQRLVRFFGERKRKAPSQIEPTAREAEAPRKPPGKGERKGEKGKREEKGKGFRRESASPRSKGAASVNAGLQRLWMGDVGGSSGMDAGWVQRQLVVVACGSLAKNEGGRRVRS